MSGSGFPTFRGENAHMIANLVRSVTTYQLHKPVVVSGSGGNSDPCPADPLGNRECGRETSHLRDLAKQAGQVVAHFFTTR